MYRPRRSASTNQPTRISESNALKNQTHLGYPLHLHVISKATAPRDKEQARNARKPPGATFSSHFSAQKFIVS